MKNFLSKIFINQRKKGNVRNKRFHNFRSAKSAAILFNASDTAVYSEAKTLLAYLGQIKIKTEGLGYADKEKIDNYYKTYTGFNFFCQKDFNYFGKPKGQNVKDFISQQYDILIDLSFSSDIHFSSICSLSKSSFIVGSVKGRISEFDLIIELKDDGTPSDYINQVKHYLETINVDNHE